MPSTRVDWLQPTSSRKTARNWAPHTPRGAAPGFGCLVDSYVLLNHESTHPEGERSTRILHWRTGTKKELVDIIQNRRNPTGMVHSGNSGPCETGETASAPPNQPQAVGAVSTKRGSSPGSGAWNALRRLRQRLSRRALSAESPIKQGVELGDSGQFHLPPVFRSSRSASLKPPPAEGREANGAADEGHAKRPSGGGP